jgi:hypothetical protein
MKERDFPPQVVVAILLNQRIEKKTAVNAAMDCCAWR